MKAGQGTLFQKYMRPSRVCSCSEQKWRGLRYGKENNRETSLKSESCQASACTVQRLFVHQLSDVEFLNWFGPPPGF